MRLLVLILVDNNDSVLLVERDIMTPEVHVVVTGN